MAIKYRSDYARRKVRSDTPFYYLEAAIKIRRLSCPIWNIQNEQEGESGKSCIDARLAGWLVCFINYQLKRYGLAAADLQFNGNVIEHEVNLPAKLIRLLSDSFAEYVVKAFVDERQEEGVLHKDACIGNMTVQPLIRWPPKEAGLG